MRLDAEIQRLQDCKPSLAECYALCRRVQRVHSRTYHFSTNLFPPEVRWHVYALYAFMRHADEIVDNPGAASLADQRAGLEAFEAETMAAMRDERAENPVLRAYANMVRERGIEPEAIAAFMQSMKMDTRVFRYQTYEDLEVYTHGSAAVVGLMMCRIMGVEDSRADPHAEALGVAMQLSNFLRDVKEDYKRGRVYLPQEDLDRFGYTEKDLAAEVVDERFEALMRFEIERARSLYAFADEGMHHIPRERRYPVRVARRLYAAILDRIEAQGYDVFSRRAETSSFEKVTVATHQAAREPGEFLALFTSRGGSRTTVRP